MTDYYEALKEAVGSLQPGDSPGRRSFFNRARRLLIERLQTADPPVPARELRSEVDAFDAAVKQIELELRTPPPAPSRRPAPAVRPPSPVRPSSQPVTPPPVAPPAPRKSPQPSAARHPAPPVAVPPRVASPQDLAIPAEDVGLATMEAGPESAAPDFVPEREPHPVVKGRARRSPIGIVLAGVVALLAVGALAYIWSGSERPSPRPPTPARQTSSRQTEPANMQYVLRRQLVYYRTVQPPGTIVVAKSQHFLYVVRPDSVGMRYTFGMGPDCAELGGLYKVSRKDGDMQNPKAAALVVGDTGCRIRQADTASAIGQNMRTPGLQLIDEDFADLFERINTDTRIVITN